MREYLNGALLFVSLLAVCSAVVLFGGALLQYLVPVYVLIAILLLTWVGKLIAVKRVSWIGLPVHVPILGFVAYAVVRYFGSPIEYPSRLELFTILMAAAIYFAASFNLHRKHDRMIAVAVLMLLAFGQAVYGLVQFATGTQSWLWLQREDYLNRASGTFYNPNHLAGFFEIVLPLFLAQLLVHRSPSYRVQANLVWRLLLLYVGVFGVVGLYATGSRGGWLGMAAAVMTVVIGAWCARDLMPRTVDLVLGVLVVLAAVVFLYTDMGARWRNAMGFNPNYVLGESPFDWRDKNVGGRLELWKTTLKIAQDHPLWGTGPGTWQWMYPRYRPAGAGSRPEYAHADILQLVSDYGLVGAGFVLVALCGLFSRIIRIVRESHEPDQRAFALGTAGAMVALLVHSVFDFSLHMLGNALALALLLGLTSAITLHRHEGERRSLPLSFKYGLAIALVGATGAMSWWGIRTAVAASYTAAGDEAALLYNWDRARENYFQAIAVDPSMPEAHLGLGITYWTEALWLTDPAEDQQRRQLALMAVGALHRAVALNPYESRYLLRLAAAAELAGDVGGATQAYRRALEVDPHNAFTYYRLGIFSERLGEWEAAVAAYRKAAQLGSPDAREWLAQHAIR